uniref:Uncharacterized protein n=1 Tax=Avena sativa TaxID=4498 RepID=A0ACD5UU18_AVESA
MGSVAPSDDGGGDTTPESAPVNHSSLDPPADPQRNGESPALLPSAGDVDMLAMGASEIPDPARAGCGEKRPLPSRPAPCPECARRKMILRGIEPAPRSDDRSSASPVPGTGMELPKAVALETNGSPSAIGLCGLCEFRKKIHLNRRLRRKSEPPAPPPESFMPVSSLDDMSRLVLEQKLQARARRGKKRPLSVEEERGYRECDVGKKLMRHKWDGLRHKWEGLYGELSPEMLGFGAAAGGHDLLEMPGFGAAAGGRDMLEVPSFTELLQQIKLETPGFGAAARGWALPGFGAAARGWDLPGVGAAVGIPDLLEMPGFGDLQEMPGFGAVPGGHDLLDMPGFRAAAEKMMLAMRSPEAEKMMQAMQKVCAKFAPQDAQKSSSSAAARVDASHEKLAQMTKVLTKVLHEGSVLQVSTKLMRLLCPDVGSSAPTGGGLDGNDWGLVEEAIDNLVNQTGEGMQDIVKTVIPKVFSKEILYDLIMACVGRYPQLLEDDKGKLTKEKYDQYQKQLDLMVNLTTVYENDPENFSKIMKLMCKIGRCGPLPSEVIDDISPGLDPSTMEQLYTGMLERLHNVDRASPVHTNPSSK